LQDWGFSPMPNSYKAQGIDAIDCDGPLQVMIFAIPAFLVYGAGTLTNGSARRLLPAMLCAAICVPLAINIATALIENRRNEREPACTGAPLPAAPRTASSAS
jgi:hypothetical protein